MPSNLKGEEIFLFAYFKGNGDGLHLAYSTDGYIWKELKNDTIFLKSAVGTDKLMRDPCIIRGGDGKFYMVWTVSWNERGIGYASSEDLLNRTALEQPYLPSSSTIRCALVFKCMFDIK